MQTGYVYILLLFKKEAEVGSFAVLSGVEVSRDIISGSLQMTKHTCICYNFGERDDAELIWS